MRKVTLPSGAELTVNIAPFKDAKALFQALLKEWKDMGPDLPSNLGKMFSSAFSSLEVEKALWPCLTRCLYNGEKITPDVFEPDEARQDFIPACLEAVSDDITPFTKGLFSESKIPSLTATGDLELRPKTTS